MEQNINIKTGDRVPVKRNIYYVVEKPFVKSDTTDEEEDYSFYKVGDPIVIKAIELEQYVASFKDFLNNNCRKADTDEISAIYNDLYTNARIGDVYKDGSYGIKYFFIVESHFDELWKKFDYQNENCLWYANRKLKNLIIKLCECRYSYIDVCIGYYKEKLFLFTNFDGDHDYLLKICRKATSEETEELSLYVKKMRDGYHKKFED